MNNEMSAYDSLGIPGMQEQADSVRMEKAGGMGGAVREGDGAVYGGFLRNARELLQNARDRWKELAVGTMFLLLFAVGMAAVVMNTYAFFKVDSAMHFWCNPVFVVLESAIPFCLWVKATEYGIFNYHRNKRLLFRFCVANFLLLSWGCYRVGIERIFRMVFFSLPVCGSLSPKAVVSGYYAASGAAIVFPLVLVWVRLEKGMRERMMDREIIRFRMERIKPDFPWKRRFCYDMTIVRNLQTGKKYRILEDDRRLHMKGVGSTGGGKTATLLTVAYEADLRQKVKNMDYQKKEAEKLLREGRAYMVRDFEDIDFNIEYIKPHPDLEQRDMEEVEKRLHELKYRSKNAGITVMCPTEAFCDELYEKAKAKGLRVNRVDPCVNADGTQKEDFIGFSPIYVPVIEGEAEESYFFRVFTAAKLYADVNQAIFELSGKGDPYFTGLNKNISVTAAVAVIIAYPLLHQGQYATIEHVQETVNDFKAIKKYREALVAKYGKRNALGKLIVEEGSVDVGPNLQFIIDRIDRDFLGGNSVKINEQATGLRNIIDESLMNPRIRNILCAKKTLNIDHALEMGELTLVNFEIALGSDSTGFGMFFMLSFIQSVLRRPGTLKTRLPHFFAIDEAPMLFHPRLELSTTLFRQFNVSMMLFMQSLTQYEKNDTTRYLKNVLTGNCAHQFIFGRASREDMEFYEKLSGYKWDIEESETVRETALTDENTMQAYSHSFELEQNERITTEDVRYREFLECTVFSARNSTPLEPFLGKTDFLPKGYDIRMKRYHVNWHDYFDENLAPCAEAPQQNPLSVTGGARTELHSYQTGYDEDDKVEYDAPLFMNPEENGEREEETEGKVEEQKGGSSDDCDDEGYAVEPEEGVQFERQK